MRIVFLTYINRSGSTFLVNQLSKHPGIIIVPEGEILVKELLFNPAGVPDKTVLSTLISDHKLKQWNWDHSALQNINLDRSNAELFFDLLEIFKNSNSPDAEVVVFKAWELIYTLGKLPAKLIDKFSVRYYGLIRDPRAVFASQSTNLYLGKSLERNSLRTTMKWKEFISICTSGNHRITIIYYEKMILEYNLFFEDLFINLDLTWREDYNNDKGKVFEQLPEDQRILHPDIDLAPQSDSVDRWKHIIHQSDVDIIQLIASKNIQEKGYVLVRGKGPIFQTIYKLFKNLLGYWLIR